jgi:hypothetical protein
MDFRIFTMVETTNAGLATPRPQHVTQHIESKPIWLTIFLCMASYSPAEEESNKYDLTAVLCF